MALTKNVNLSSKVVIALMLGGLISACSSVSPPSGSSGNSQAGRYSITQDRAPSVALDPATIRDVIPEPINRTMAGNRSPYTVNGQSYRVMASEEGFQETGLASWYGEKFHGHSTMSASLISLSRRPTNSVSPIRVLRWSMLNPLCLGRSVYSRLPAVNRRL